MIYENVKYLKMKLTHIMLMCDILYFITGARSHGYHPDTLSYQHSPSATISSSDSRHPDSRNPDNSEYTKHPDGSRQSDDPKYPDKGHKRQHESDSESRRKIAKIWEVPIDKSPSGMPSGIPYGIRSDVDIPSGYGNVRYVSNVDPCNFEENS